MNSILNRDLLSFALSSVPIELSIWNPISQRFTCTRLQANLHDLDLNTFDGRLESFLNTVHFDDAHALHHFFLNASGQEPGFPVRNYRVVHQNRSVHWIQISTCWRSRSALLIAAQDITENRSLGTTVIRQAWQRLSCLRRLTRLLFL